MGCVEFFFSGDGANFKVIPLIESDRHLNSNQCASASNSSEEICQRKVLGLPYVYANYDGEVILDEDVVKEGFFVCHEYFFDDGAVFYREGMSSIFGIKYVMKDGLMHDVIPELFPPFLPYYKNWNSLEVTIEPILETILFPNMDVLQTNDRSLKKSILTFPLAFNHLLNIEFDKVKLRNYIADMFIVNLKATGGRKSLSFNFHCYEKDFLYFMGNDLINYYSTLGKF